MYSELARVAGALTALVILSACSLGSDTSTVTHQGGGPPIPDGKNNGGVDGGGGKAVVCRDSSGAITRAETLDLFEAKAIYGYAPVYATDRYPVQVDLAVARLPQSTRGIVKAYTEIVLKAMKVLDAGTEILPIDDALEVAVPKGCKTEQLANFRTENSILVDGEIWAALSETDRAGLILHEAVYAVNRLARAEDSRQSRHIVGRAFDPHQKWEDVNEGVPKDALICISADHPFAMRAYREAQGWKLQFEILGRGFVFSRTTTSVWAPQFDFSQAVESSFVRGEDRIGNSHTMIVWTNSLIEGGDDLLLTQVWEPLKDSNGRAVPGYQIPRYYLEWTSRTHDKLAAPRLRINCGLQVNN